MTKCECGCGGEANPGKRFIWGHNARINSPETAQKRQQTKRINKEIKEGRRPAPELKYCECGCGQIVKEGCKFVQGHYIKVHNPMKNPKTAKKVSEAKKGVPTWNKGLTKETDERINKMAETKRGRTKENHEGMKRMAETHKQLWQDPEYIEKVLTALHKALHIKPNKPEKLIYKLLQNILPNEYALNVEGHIIIDRKVPDFVNINGQKKLIEFNGDYWHTEEETKKRVELFKKYGYDTLVIWEHELEDIKAVVNKILDFHDLPSISCTKQSAIK